ncbi:unnamed protein product [Auanema sp. JU1783]|nr:unnamed protein product [Auanema sp. JU1783]
MWTSSMVLSLATVSAIVGIVLVGIAVVTDSWTEFQVNRREIINGFQRDKNQDLSIRLKDAFNQQLTYFSRTYGLFHVCFPESVPSDIGSFDKFGSRCIVNKDYFPSAPEQDTYSSTETLRLYLLRSTVILYVFGIVLIVISSTVGIFGCWRRSSSLVSLTALLLLLSVMFLASGMVCWHVVNYLEHTVLETAPFYKSWEPILKSTTRFHHGYSYVSSWIGIMFLLVSTVFMYFAKKAIKNEHEMLLAAKSNAYIMPYDKATMMVPYNIGYNTCSAYSGYPYYNQNMANGYYGYMTYGRMGGPNNWHQNTYT